MPTPGGTKPRRPPGAHIGELFYKSGNRMMVVPVETGRFSAGAPRLLFELLQPERVTG